MPTMRRGIAAAAAALVLTAGVTGCSKSVDGGDVESELTKALEKANAGKVSDPSCGELDAEVGATSSCEVELNGKKQKFTAEVTSVDDNKVRFNFKPAK